MGRGEKDQGHFCSSLETPDPEEEHEVRRQSGGIYQQNSIRTEKKKVIRNNIYIAQLTSSVKLHRV